MTHSSLYFHASFSLRMSKHDKNMIRMSLKKITSPHVLHRFSMGRSVLSLSVRSQALGPCALSPLPVAPRRSVAGAAARRWRPRRPQRPRAPSCSSPHSLEWLQMASGSAWSDMVSITGSVHQILSSIKNKTPTQQEKKILVDCLLCRAVA